MDEKRAAEELNFIKNIINESRSSFALNGKPYIFWGILIVVGLFLEFTRKFYNWEFHYMFIVWIFLVAIGWLYAFVEYRKRKGESKTTTLGKKILGSVWLACGVTMTIFGFLGTLSGAIKGLYVSPVISMILAIAYYVTGVIYDYKWQRNLSIGWWLGAIFLFFYPSQYTNLIMALMMIGLQIIPGIILLNKVKSTSTGSA